jgi:glycosyltransferase involved in cell wall biosynthesis
VTGVGGGRVALCHEWVTTYGGSEQVASRLAEALDVRDVYTFTAEPELAKRLFGDCRIHTSRIGTLGVAMRHWQWLLPLMPRWWRSIDLRPFDLVMTSSHATVNSIAVGDNATHISYCSTPMRYAWDWRHELGRLPAPLRPTWPAVAAGLRRADRRRAGNVDLFIANSNHVAARIRAYYGKRSVVIYPPVDTHFFTPDESEPRTDAFLYAGRLVAYKRPDLAVDAATKLGVPLVVAGSGPELPRLRSIAGPTVQFVADPTREELRRLYRRARALVFPGIEDFGMVLVEAQACGTPVIALRRGGAEEAVRDGQTGSLYDESLAETIRSFDAAIFDSVAIRHHAEQFDADRFNRQIVETVRPILDSSPSGRPDVIRTLLEDAARD